MLTGRGLCGVYAEVFASKSLEVGSAYLLPLLDVPTRRRFILCRQRIGTSAEPSHCRRARFDQRIRVVSGKPTSVLF
jgi:hypothetical protein